MTVPLRLLINPLLISVLLLIVNLPVCDAASVDFEKQIRPLLMKHCGDCHGATEQNSGLRIDAKQAAFKGGDGGAVIVPGKSGDSELVRRVASDDPDERMPPEGAPLSMNDIELLRRWIDQGADWPETDYDREATRDQRLEHWAFQPLRISSETNSQRNGQSLSDHAKTIDNYVAAGLAEHGLKASPKADRRTLIRRLYFDLIGLPPTPEEVSRFVADNAPDTFERLVERLLDSPRYGERWAQHWLDVVRYADTHGFEVNTPRENAWPYRDYVIQAFNEDKPFDQFIREQLAGDAFETDAATGFLVAAAVLLPGQIGQDEESKRLARQDSLDEMIVGTSATFLGLTIGCARCHDHKFDPITARDYYALQAFFAGVRYGDRPIRDAAQKERLAAASKLGERMQALEAKLQQFEPLSFNGRTVIIDEEDKDHVSVLKTPNGPGSNPAGTDRGYRDDVGASDRIGNLSKGRYTWWNNVPGEDVLTYNPEVAGHFRLWLSWGAHGSGVHTRDARYILDKDGDLTTTVDQHEVARIDQYFQAGVSEGTTEQKPLWSGLADSGIVELNADSRLLVRGGETGTGITADVIVLQEMDSPITDLITDSIAPSTSGDSPLSGPALPQLREPVNAQRNTERFQAVLAKFLRFTTLETIDDNKHQPCIDELEVYDSSNPANNIALASVGTVTTSSGNYSETGKHQLKHVNDGQYSNDRSWISNKYGGGWVQLEFPTATPINRVVWGRDRSGSFKDRLPIRYHIETSLDGTEWTTVASHDDRVPIGTPYDPVRTLLRNRTSKGSEDPSVLITELEKLKQQKAELETVQTVYGGQFGNPEKTFLLRRGDPEQRVTEISPAVPAVFQSSDIPENTPEQERRIRLAEWIAKPDNPLTARVMVNRIWQHHFGHGLVATPSDFGLNGTRPSHPELLDWLASEFIESGWSIKHLHRLILLSATWQQSSFVDAESARIDRDNKWLWRFLSRRLEGEAIRDSMLAVSGELNLKMGGPGFNFFKTRGGLSGFPEVDEFGPEEMRRMIYSHKIRMERVPVFGAFDCPDAGQATPARTQSTTAIQALNLFNSQFVADRAAQLAERIHGEHPNDSKQQIVRAFELTFGRTPTSVELSASASVVTDHGVATLCRVLFNSSEFLFIP
ncbi:MAG: DUF1553 domain-containing protein [Rhodopirellula sp.]|nr:DUF1553 domain-containing protein [Rhodopirellula sp.]